jgi:menaquinone-dependent protoporphyrinogen IX oxidase
MKVLVTAPSKYGATAEIAKSISDVLNGRGIELAITPVEEVTAIDDYDAVVAGSAVLRGPLAQAGDGVHREQRGSPQHPARMAVLERPDRKSAEARGGPGRRSATGRGLRGS